MGYKLWIDDFWDDPESPFRHPPDDFVPVKSSDAAIILIETMGELPEFISYDHDLSGGDTAMRLIDYMIEHYYDSDVPDYQVHSANPIGAQNIIAKMESWKKSQKL